MVDKYFAVTTEACIQRTIRVEASNEAVSSVACHPVVVSDTRHNNFAIGLNFDVPATVLITEICDLPTVLVENAKTFLLNFILKS